MILECSFFYLGAKGYAHTIAHAILPPVILWIELGGKPKWLLYWIPCARTPFVYGILFQCKFHHCASCVLIKLFFFFFFFFRSVDPNFMLIPPEHTKVRVHSLVASESHHDRLGSIIFQLETAANCIPNLRL